MPAESTEALTIPVTDPFAPMVIAIYASFCRSFGCPAEVVDSLQEHAERVRRWQEAHPERVTKPGT